MVYLGYSCLMALNTKITIFLDVTLSCRHFLMFWRNLQVSENYSYTLMMEAVYSFKTSSNTYKDM
jgi:hypothetical protein